MPEGPEVKRCSEVIENFIGSDLCDVELVSGKLARRGVKRVGELSLPTAIESVTSRSKSIFIRLEGGHTLVSTLGMSGWWYPPHTAIGKGDLSSREYTRVIDTIKQAEKHTRMTLRSSCGASVNYVDPRNFGNFYVMSDDESESRKNSFGMDFLNDESITARAVEETVKKILSSRRPIGEVLLDQSVLSGLGNIYRAETMYLAGVSPHRTGNSLSEEHATKIMAAAELVLTVAYNGRGAMSYPTAAVRVFHRLDERSPPSIDRHLVYGCRVDMLGNPVTSEPVGGRRCWWVPEVQK